MHREKEDEMGPANRNNLARRAAALIEAPLANMWAFLLLMGGLNGVGVCIRSIAEWLVAHAAPWIALTFVSPDTIRTLPDRLKVAVAQWLTSLKRRRESIQSHTDNSPEAAPAEPVLAERVAK